MAQLAITDIDVAFGDREIRPGWEKIGVDLNQGARGEWIFVTCFRDPAKQEAGKWISEVHAVGLRPDQGLPDESATSFHFVRKNLNEGAGGVEIYLRYERDGKDPIYDLTVRSSRSPQELEGEYWTVGTQDMNEGTTVRGEALHLAYRRNTQDGS